MLDEELINAINIIEKYNLYNSIEDKDDSYIIVGDKPYFFKTEKGTKTIYDLFVENLHIHISEDKNEKIYSIRLKKRDEDWAFAKDDSGIWDVSHPLNEHFEVFVCYDIPVLNVTKATGYDYKHGSWDKYVYVTLSQFTDYIKSMTIVSRFDEEYNRKKQ